MRSPTSIPFKSSKSHDFSTLFPGPGKGGIRPCDQAIPAWLPWLLAIAACTGHMCPLSETARGGRLVFSMTFEKQTWWFSWDLYNLYIIIHVVLCLILLSLLVWYVCVYCTYIVWCMYVFIYIYICCMYMYIYIYLHMDKTMPQSG